MITLTSDPKINSSYLSLLGHLVQVSHFFEGEPTRQSSATVFRSIDLFHQHMQIAPGEFPFCLSRKINLRMAWEEMLFFLNGKTQTKELEEKGVFFWKGNTTNQFLEERGLGHLDEGDMGKAYGYQWRHPKNDQLVKLLKGIEDSIRTGVSDRRLIVNLWNPSELDEMALPPCWYSCQFLVQEGELDLILNNRSLDVPFGFWYAVSQYRMLQMAIAAIFDLRVGYMSIRMADQHMYASQKEWAEELLGKTLPTLNTENQNTISLNKPVGVNPLDALLNVKYEDFKIDYRFYNGNPMRTSRPEMEA